MSEMDFCFIPDSAGLCGEDAMPPRSRLFAMDPIGIGTAEAEGLVSYVIRLASAHAVSPRRLVRDEFAKASPELDKYRRSGPFFKSATRSVNGHHVFSQYFADAIETLCCINPSAMTLLSLKAMLPFNEPRLFALNQRWCPACYDRMRDAKNDVYQPLVWSFELYRVCHQHHVLLVDQCPSCGKYQESIPKSASIGFCCHCSVWMGGIGEPMQAGSEHELWFANAVCDVVAALPKMERYGNRDQFACQVQKAIDIFAMGSRRRFCFEVGLKESAFQNILSGDKRPTFLLWLVVAHGLGMRPSTFLIDGPSDVNAVGGLRKLPQQLWLRAKRSPLAKERYKGVEKSLRKIAFSGDGELSVCDVARKLGVNRSCLRYFWPELCREISSIYRAKQAVEKIKNLDLMCQKMIAAVDALIDRGIYPSQPVVVRELRGTGVSLAHPGVRVAYRQQVLLRLGGVGKAFGR